MYHNTEMQYRVSHNEFFRWAIGYPCGRVDRIFDGSLKALKNFLFCLKNVQLVLVFTVIPFKWYKLVELDQIAIHNLFKLEKMLHFRLNYVAY